ncbi:MAG: ferrous iron transport protein B [Gammaproteobacteria bacterium CG11_big_fil_rev_8_21_14_0_20_46_22]|nr:MAG: ferrous iron transport protein B [Gammaproteobacteria bacterium CG12_big_fil_rev_8_21_14_0_65_46_12]PIR11470.1 MAG: ferrous iron transport protein B [Gammaproteobacteria bacterium CG11_big_fil_rev_8_21_14_0_20_46_22]
MKRVAFIGNPNCGKTTIFNRLSGSSQKVGNWAGVTVDKKTAQMRCGDERITLIDLPGIYSLNVSSGEGAIDEAIASNFLMSQEADLFVNILDASNLQRHLYLTLQLLDMQVPMIVVLNMSDVAKRQHKAVNAAELSKRLSCPVLELVGSRGKGVKALQTAICEYVRGDLPKALSFHPRIEDTIEQLVPLTPQKSRWQAIRLLEKDRLVSVILDNDTQAECERIIQGLEVVTEEDSDIVMADARYQTMYQLCDAVIVQHKIAQSMTRWLDRLFMHRFLGIPLFLFIMYLMFEISMNVGTLLQPLFDISSSVIFIDGVNHLAHALGLPLWMNALLAQGIGLGINTVATFIPQIGLMFLCLSFLEDSGYMSRAAFVVDRFMQAVGLPGKAFIPLIIGFGCNVPAIMATRTLGNTRDRILTTMMSPFMSCGARLAIFVVFASAFYPAHGGIVVFSLYLLGILVAMLTGYLLKVSVLKGKEAPFVMELPNYHWPYFKSIFIMTWQRLKRFIFRAGKVIVPVCVLVGTLNAVQLDGKIVPQGSPQSILSDVGRVITPVLRPLGVHQDNWPATVGLITGTLAKEVVVGTLNTLYTQGQFNDKPSDFHLLAGLQQAWQVTLQGFSSLFSAQRLNPFTANEADHDMTQSAMGNMAQRFLSPWAAYAYLIFVLLYIPCVSTMGVIAREIGKGWAYFATFWSFSVAYAVATIFYQTVMFSAHRWFSACWIAGMLAFQFAQIMVMYAVAGRRKRRAHP